VSADSPSSRSTERDAHGPAPRPDLREQLLAVCQDVIAPLVRADGGEVFLVGIEPGTISLHLAGTCAGCPGAQITAASVIEPAIHAVAPTVRVTVTAGIQIPDGAVTMTAARAAPDR
jgi:Fe-S cluster biogenesis protein NfuA